MTPASFLPDILADHLEEIDELLELRASVFRFGGQTARWIAALDERLLAHADGVVIAGEAAVPLLQAGLDEGPPGLAAAVGFVLGRDGLSDAVLPVFAPLLARELGREERKQAVWGALRLGVSKRLTEELAARAASGPPPGHIVALLARLDRLPGLPLLEELLDGGEASRLWGLRALPYLVGGAQEAAMRRMLGHRLEGAAKDGGSVRVAALEAAAWLGAPWLRQEIVEHARNPEAVIPDELDLFCALAEGADTDLLIKIGQCEALGSARFDLLAASGSPAILDLLLDVAGSRNSESAESAARAYSAITGAQVRFLAPVESPALQDEEGEHSERAPDAEALRRHFVANRMRFDHAERYVGGLIAAQTDPLSPTFDAAMRRRLCLRGRAVGAWTGRACQVDPLPLPLSG